MSNAAQWNSGAKYDIFRQQMVFLDIACKPVGQKGGWRCVNETVTQTGIDRGVKQSEIVFVVHQNQTGLFDFVHAFGNSPTSGAWFSGHEIVAEDHIRKKNGRRRHDEMFKMNRTSHLPG